MHSVVRWAVVILATLVIVGLVVYARGAQHHRGDDVGESAAPAGMHRSNRT
jgi:hypothetical protein